jgi:cell division septation protein DedD
MSEQSSIKSTEKSTESLRAALGCLDLSLEAELALFRRQSQAPKALVGSLDVDEQVALSMGIQEAVEPREEEEFAPYLEEPIDKQTESESVIPDLIQEASDARNLVYLSGPSQEDPETLPEPYGADITAEPKSFERFLDPSIEDYLESSEALLKHLEDSASSTTERQVKPLTRRSWVSGLKAIAIILGLLGLLSLVAFLIVAWLTPKPRQLEPAPQLSPQPTQVPSTSSQIDSSGIAVATTPRALPSDVATFSPPTQLPAGLTRPSPSPSASVGKADFYIVVANYNNPESLKMAQKLVPDAYLNEVGGQQRIQLAWLDNLQKAETFVKDLKNKGFAASIMTQN